MDMFSRTFNTGYWTNDWNIKAALETNPSTKANVYKPQIHTWELYD